MTDQQVTAPAKRDQIVNLEFKIGCHVERNDVMRLEAALATANLADGTHLHELTAKRGPATSTPGARGGLALDAV